MSKEDIENPPTTTRSIRNDALETLIQELISRFGEKATLKEVESRLIEEIEKDETTK